MKSNFYEKLYSSEDKNKKILMDKMSKLLDESISECIDLRQRQINENKTKIENDSDNKPIKNIIMDNNIHHLYDYNHRNSRIERIRNMFHYLEEESETLRRLIENTNNNLENVG